MIPLLLGLVTQGQDIRVDDIGSLRAAVQQAKPGTRILVGPREFAGGFYVTNINGTANPYFGLPFVSEGVGGGMDTFYSPQTDDNYRAMLAYDLDLTKQTGILKWLGHHRILGLAARQNSDRAIDVVRSLASLDAIGPPSRERAVRDPASVLFLAAAQREGIAFA